MCERISKPAKFQAITGRYSDGSGEPVVLFVSDIPSVVQDQLAALKMAEPVLTLAVVDVPFSAVKV
jgi:hypothetical protein